ncbi:MAG: hypothetical protein RL299_1780 [Pseudomonadota bacterium]|jgi:hypothetical protein
MKKFLAALAILALPTTLYAAPGDMNVATFLAKADALRAKGAMAMFSSDVEVLKTEGKAAGEAYRARLAKERAVGKPSSCPPKGANVNSNELLNHLRAYPATAKPKVSMKQAMADFFIKKYPCK